MLDLFYNGSASDFNSSSPSPPYTMTSAATSGVSLVLSEYCQGSRFAAETLMAFVAVLVNSAACCYSDDSRNRRYCAYQLLFRNLAASNTMAALTSWIANNLLFLVSNNADICTVIRMMAFFAVTHLMFVTAASLSLLGFSVVQLMAVSKPMFHDNLLTRGMVIRVLKTSWALLALVSLLPFAVCLVLDVGVDACDKTSMERISNLVTYFSIAAVLVICVVYVCSVCACLRIYTNIRNLRRRLSICSSDSGDQVIYERRTFRSIVVLVGTMTAFTLPYNAAHLVSLCRSSASLYTGGLLVYMNLLPYVKYTSDPLIYRHGLAKFAGDFSRAIARALAPLKDYQGHRKCAKRRRQRARLRRLPAFRIRDQCLQKDNVHLQMVTSGRRVTTL